MWPKLIKYLSKVEQTMRFKKLGLAVVAVASIATATEAQAGYRHRLNSAGPFWPYLLNFGWQVLQNELPQTNNQTTTTLPPAQSDPVQNTTITSMQTKLNTIESNLKITTTPPPNSQTPKTEIVVPNPTPPQRPDTNVPTGGPR
jgi:hypothetical protein